MDLFSIILLLTQHKFEKLNTFKLLKGKNKNLLPPAGVKSKFNINEMNILTSENSPM